MTDRTYYSREAEMRANRERTGAIMMFLAVGLGLGALLALLLAPQDGKKTRKNIAGALEDGLGDSLQSTAATVRRLEKDFADLRKSVEDRVSHLR